MRKSRIRDPETAFWKFSGSAFLDHLIPLFRKNLPHGMTPKVVSKCLELGCFGFDLKTVLLIGLLWGPQAGGGAERFPHP